jgi:quercetin dioxygenase-like cupin family protein
MAEFLPEQDGKEREAFTPHIYPGVEMVYVINGSLEVRRKGEPHQLHPRDVLYVSAETPRTYRCLGDTPASALIISFDADTGSLRRTRRPLPAPATT